MDKRLLKSMLCSSSSILFVTLALLLLALILESLSQMDLQAPVLELELELMLHVFALLKVSLHELITLLGSLDFFLVGILYRRTFSTVIQGINLLLLYTRLNLSDVAITVQSINSARK